jgi:predicted transcriptional regulator
MSSLTQFSRRERQIMDVVFAQQGATVLQICQALPDPPTPMAVRRMLAILQEKGHLKRKKQGREYIYLPRVSKERAGVNALRQVLATFFGGSVEAALATHLEKPGSEMSDEELTRLMKLIDEHQSSANRAE